MEKIRLMIKETVEDIQKLENKIKENDIAGSLEIFVFVSANLGRIFAYKEMFEEITGECLDVDFVEDIFKIRDKLTELRKSVEVFL